MHKTRGNIVLCQVSRIFELAGCPMADDAMTALGSLGREGAWTIAPSRIDSRPELSTQSFFFGRCNFGPCMNSRGCLCDSRSFSRRSTHHHGVKSVKPIRHPVNLTLPRAPLTPRQNRFATISVCLVSSQSHSRFHSQLLHAYMHPQMVQSDIGPRMLQSDSYIQQPMIGQSILPRAESS